MAEKRINSNSRIPIADKKKIQQPAHSSTMGAQKDALNSKAELWKGLYLCD